MKNPGVQILMPFRDAERWIADAIDSIRGQTMEAWELLAIDDGSRDRSVEFLRDCGDSRVAILANQGSGLVDALNTGLRSAKSALVARFDADDLMMPDRLLRQMEVFDRDPSAGVVGSLVESFGETPTDGWLHYIRWLNSVVTREDVQNEIYAGCPFAHPSVMFRRELVIAAGGYRSGEYPEDYELWLRLNARGIAMEKVEAVLTRWRDRPARATRTDPRYRKEAFDQIRAEYLAADPRLSTRRFAIWGAGRITRRRASSLIEIAGDPVVWIDIDPRKIGREVAGVPVVDPAWLFARKERPFVLVYIARHGAREMIAPILEECGYRKGLDWVVVG